MILLEPRKDQREKNKKKLISVFNFRDIFYLQLKLETRSYFRYFATRINVTTLFYIGE